jgi:hypothetical protein
LFEVDNKHLEYFPIVNQRVYPIGMSDQINSSEDSSNQYKKILNVQFRETYMKIIYLTVHQQFSNGTKIMITERMKLQLAYYLQLQDRIEEAIIVFKQVNLQKLQENGQDLTSQIAYDYMTAYFEFFQETDSN